MSVAVTVRVADVALPHTIVTGQRPGPALSVGERTVSGVVAQVARAHDIAFNHALLNGRTEIPVDRMVYLFGGQVNRRLLAGARLR